MHALAVPLAALLVLGSASVFAADIHVAPVGGDDAADGSSGHPVATLARALDRVREIRAAEPGRAAPLVVELAAGRHELAGPLVIGPKHSGTEASPTIFRAAEHTLPVVSGGRVITGWQVEAASGSERWTAHLPDVQAGEWSFAQLFVNGQRRFRPRLPASGWHTIAATLPPSDAAQGKGHDRFGFCGSDLRADWANLDDVEVLGVHRWTMSRMRIKEVVPPAADTPGTVAFTGHTRAITDWCSFPQGNRFLVENVREALGEPGSWYLDRHSGTLTYCPLPGESPATVTAVAPRLDRLVELRGDLAAGRFVEHVRFEGLAFADGNWVLRPEGQSFPQAEVNVGGTLVATAARHIRFADCSMRHMGRSAIEFGAGCRDCVVERCDLADLGGGGALIGTAGGPKSWGTPARVEGPEATVERITVRECTIRHGGRIHSAAVGVWIGHASHCAVERCDIFDFTYTGVSVGWVWGYGESRSHHNRIARNRIHHLGHGVLSDMGGVYTLGVSPGTVVEGNVIHDITSHDYGGWGLYTDEGSSEIVMRGNLVYRTSSGGFHQHFGRGNLIENNIFAAARDWQLQRTKIEDHTSFTFARNIVWWNSDRPLVRGDWSKGLITRANCYWNASGPVTFPGGVDLAARQQAGQDGASIVTDPRFADPAANDFALASDSPALALGFEPLTPAEAGPRRPPAGGDLAPVPTPWPEANASR